METLDRLELMELQGIRVQEQTQGTLVALGMLVLMGTRERRAILERAPHQVTWAIRGTQESLEVQALLVTQELEPTLVRLAILARLEALALPLQLQTSIPAMSRQTSEFRIHIWLDRAAREGV